MEPPLPPNWEKHWSKTWSKYYYFNKSNGKTSFDHPALAGSGAAPPSGAYLPRPMIHTYSHEVSAHPPPPCRGITAMEKLDSSHQRLCALL